MEEHLSQSIVQDKRFHVALQIVEYMRGKLVSDADSGPKPHNPEPGIQNSELRTQHSKLPGR
jgi:hypothetical protein